MISLALDSRSGEGTDCGRKREVELWVTSKGEKKKVKPHWGLVLIWIQWPGITGPRRALVSNGICDREQRRGINMLHLTCGHNTQPPSSHLEEKQPPRTSPPWLHFINLNKSASRWTSCDIWRKRSQSEAKRRAPTSRSRRLTPLAPFESSSALKRKGVCRQVKRPFQPESSPTS